MTAQKTEAENKVKETQFELEAARTVRLFPRAVSVPMVECRMIYVGSEITLCLYFISSSNIPST
jgi:hypothetical protein